MAKPRIFISSTFYDLRYVREDIGRFVREQGYEPVLYERGDVAYGRKESPQEYCYKEIERCDILVSIIGGRYGSPSSTPGYSVTQKELRKAIESGKQVYIFVEKNVKAEHEVYKVNKEVDIKFRYADNRKIYEFLDEIDGLPQNNPIFTFDSPKDIIDILREQWAGLFQRLLQDEVTRMEVDVLMELKSVLATLHHVAASGDNIVTDPSSVLVNCAHPAFARIKSLLSIPYRVVFLNLDELSALLRVRGYKEVPEEFWDEPSYREWSKTEESVYHTLKVRSDLFDETGRLRPVSAWRDDAIQLDKVHLISDDDVPF